MNEICIEYSVGKVSVETQDGRILIFFHDGYGAIGYELEDGMPRKPDYEANLDAATARTLGLALMEFADKVG